MAENVEESVTRRRRRSRHRSALSTRAGDEAEIQGKMGLPIPGDLIAEKYRIDELLGRGGMGAVYAATHLVSGKRVAVKFMLPSPSHAAELADRFIREARATARINHPNVVDVHDVGRKDGSVYLVMELLNGESLAQRLDRAPVAASEAAAMLMPALRGVAAAHTQGVIHRDLKPDNIFLCRAADGEPRETKVLDFGISKIAAEERDMALTQSGTVMGTPYYMSPEQIRGLRDVDERGDVYAFGVILYEMLADCYPFDADTYNELILKIATTDPVPLLQLDPTLDPTLAAIVMRAMARDPQQRFRSVAELAAVLEPFAGGVTFRLSKTPQIPLPLPAQLPIVTFTDTTQRSAAASAAAARRRKLALAGVALALVLAGLGLWAMRRPPVEPAGFVAKPAPAPAPVAAVPPEPSAPAAGARPAAVAPPVVHATPPAAAPPTAAGAAGESRSQRASRKRERAEARAARAAEQERPAADSPALPSNWDERLPTAIPQAPGNAPATPRKSVAGDLSSDDL